MTRSFANFKPTTETLYYELLASFLDLFIRSQAPLIREMKRADEMAHEESPMSNEFENREAFRDLLKFVTYLCNVCCLYLLFFPTSIHSFS